MDINSYETAESCRRCSCRGGCSCSSPKRNLKYYQRTQVQMTAVLLFGYTAVIYVAFCVVNNRHAVTTESRALRNSARRSEVCSDPETSYKQFAKQHANLTIKLLSELDGVLALQSEQAARPREITIITQMSVDRSSQLEKMASSWGGALCVAVHVKTRADIVDVYRELKSLHERIEAQRRCRLHLQMVMEEGFESDKEAIAAYYPVNALRNVALSMAATDLVFLLDVDFIPSPGLHEKLTGNEKVYSDLVRRAKHDSQLLVVPAFQVTSASVKRPRDGRLYPNLDLPIPQNMEELRERWRNGTVDSFRATYSIAHGPTGYGHFVHPLTTKPYHVLHRELYEPYVVAAREAIPKFDERFRGYGKNKIAHLYNCAVLGFKFVVLPEVYVFDSPHIRTALYEVFMGRLKESTDPCTIRNIMNFLYDTFKREINYLVQLG